jgi:hypothetical protein
MAVRRDGSSAEQLQIPGGDGTSFFDAGTKRVFRVDPHLKWASVRAAGKEEAARYLVLNPDCMSAYGGRVVVATCTPNPEKVLGYSVDAVTRSTKADPSRETRYLAAPALNYFALREAKYQNGSLAETVETLSLVLGDPDPALFAVPDDYTTGSRADYYVAHMKSLGRVPDQRSVDFYQHSDQESGVLSLVPPRPAPGR